VYVDDLDIPLVKITEAAQRNRSQTRCALETPARQ
jgi:hypothetical protein